MHDDGRLVGLVLDGLHELLHADLHQVPERPAAAPPRALGAPLHLGEPAPPQRRELVAVAVGLVARAAAVARERDDHLALRLLGEHGVGALALLLGEVLAVVLADALDARVPARAPAPAAGLARRCCAARRRVWVDGREARLVAVVVVAVVVSRAR